jgi:hypothetical protein
MPKGPQGWTLVWRVLLVFGGLILVLAAVLATRFLPAPFRTPVVLVLLTAWLARMVYVQVWLRRMKGGINA